MLNRLIGPYRGPTEAIGAIGPILPLVTVVHGNVAGETRPRYLPRKDSGPYRASQALLAGPTGP